MKAAVYHGRGDVRVESVPDPGPPQSGEVVLEVLRGAICGSDSGEYAHGPKMVAGHGPHPVSGHTGPVVLGHEFVGRVREIGEGVDGLGVGDRVVSGAGVSCGECGRCREGRTNLCESYYTLGFHAHGGLAEAVAVPASTCVPVPDGCDDDAAAIAQPLAVALHALNRGGAGPGDCLAVIGAGGVGALLTGAAASRGAKRLIAVDVDPERLRVAEALGASHTVDARAEDPVEAVREIAGAGADVAIDAAGVPGTLAQALRAARPGGRAVMLGMPAEPPAVDVLDAILREVDLVATAAHVCATDLPEALRLLADGDLAARITDRTIDLERIVADGLVPLAEGTARGKLLVDVGGRPGDASRQRNGGEG